MIARQATPGTMIKLESVILTDFGPERHVQRVTVVRWEGQGDGTARLIARDALGRAIHGGIYGPDHVFAPWV